MRGPLLRLHSRLPCRCQRDHSGHRQGHGDQEGIGVRRRVIQLDEQQRREEAGQEPAHETAHERTQWGQCRLDGIDVVSLLWPGGTHAEGAAVDEEHSETEVGQPVGGQQTAQACLGRDDHHQREEELACGEENQSHDDGMAGARRSPTSAAGSEKRARSSGPTELTRPTVRGPHPNRSR